jgi:hypothetical protein
MSTAAMLLGGCSSARSNAERSRDAGHVRSAGPVLPTTTSVPSTSPTAPLEAWSGPIEHLFFHTLVIDPPLAFTHDRLGQGFKDFFVTEGEFRTILAQLDANGWTLVDIHRAIAGQVRVPVGRRPLVLSEDDVNYYNYERGHGLGNRLVLDGGRVRIEVVRADGTTAVTDDDLVPIVDEFVATHPEFSADGAKGVLAVTGYEGVFGERIQNPAHADAAAIARATAVANTLKATGWTIASHSYGHLDLATASLAAATRDTAKWHAVADAVVGPTDVYIYPFGSRPPPATLAMLTQAGFSIFCDIDIRPRLLQAFGHSIMSRRHIDGLSLTQQHTLLVPFFDTTTVEDVAARG